MNRHKLFSTAMCVFVASTAAATVRVQELASSWRFRQARSENWYPAAVPGTVHTDLLASGQIEDPYFRLNERGIQWVDKEDWVYETTFDVDPELLAREHVVLCFDGLDTYADVYLNDSLLLQADNMFRRWQVEAKPLLCERENLLRVYFHSPVKIDLPKHDALPYRYEACNDQSQNGGLLDKCISVFARKAGYHYGWDWGPRIVTSGIWRPVRLEAWDDARLGDVYYRQTEVSARRATIETEVEIVAAKAIPAVRVAVYDGERALASVETSLAEGYNRVIVPLRIDNPRLWWTRELGEPHLYRFTARVAAGGRLLDERSTEVGLRSLRLVRDKVADGTTFYFELNGEPLFMKGANYIPCDVFLPRVTDEIYERTIDDAAAVNMNMLRVWGGGVYEDDRFYELCDRRGILVWQDFMFACSLYPAEGAWLESVRCEAEDNLRRLRNHPCIAVWCGNNECNDAWYGWGWNERYARQGHPEYDALIERQLKRQYYEVLPELVARFSPHTPYHPSSPWAQPEGTSDGVNGDMHYWSVWHARAPISDYDVIRSRFFSEYGFQSFPGIESVKRFAPDTTDWRIGSDVMMSHQRGGSFANMRIAQYMEDEYWVPEDFAEFLYMSHVLQGDAVRTAIEAHRRDKPYCWGSLFWQHNDCWPVASWASRDWYGCWKAQHYFAKRAFDDLLVSPRIDAERLALHLVSDRRSKVRGTLTVEVLDFEGTRIARHRLAATIPANGTCVAFERSWKELLRGARREEAVLHATFDDGTRTYEAVRLLAAPKEVTLPAAKIAREVRPVAGGYEVTLSSESFARAVWLTIDGTDHRFSDNYFDLLPGERRTVSVRTPLPQAEFERQLRVLHMQQTRR